MGRRSKDTNLVVHPLLLTIPEVAATLQLGRTKVYELIAAEGLPIVKFGTATRVSMNSLQKWVEQREEQSISA
jgi:excisionase family DNA binding protein